jgi:outer membrane protein TolC
VSGHQSERVGSRPRRVTGRVVPLLLLPSTLGVPALAQTSPPVRTYSLSQTIEAALKSSAEVETATRSVQIDRKRADAELARQRPNLAFQGSATRFDEKSQVSLPGGRSLITAQDHSESVSLGVTQDLDVFGQIRTAADQARLQRLADQFVLATVRNQRILTAKIVYYDLLRAQHQVQVAEAAHATAQRQQATAVKLNAGQVGQKIDVLRANTQVANSEQDLTRAENDRDLARNNFNDLIGQPLNAPVQVEDVPGATVGIDVAGASAVGAPAPQFRPYTVPSADIAGIDVAKSIEMALQRRPEILSAQVNVRVVEKGIKLARAGLEPTFAISAFTHYYPTTSFQYARHAPSEVTFGVNFPLYDGGATHARIQEAQLQTENARTLLDRRKKDVTLDVRQADLNLLTAARQIGAANTALQQAIAARQLAQARYEGQVGLYLEVTDAQAALVQAENSQVNAVYDYLVARAQFENALGTPQIP